MALRIQNPPTEADERHYRGVQLHLYVDPECSYELTAHVSLRRVMGQVSWVGQRRRCLDASDYKPYSRNGVG